MANGQFIIPGTRENEEIRRAVDDAFVEVGVTPEIEQRLFGDVLDIQVDLEMMRGFADETTLRKYLKAKR